MQRFLKQHWIVLVAAFFLALFHLLTRPLNSDAVVPELVFRDLLAGRTMSSWHFSNALFVFPDWPLWFSIRTIVADLDLALLLHAFVIYALILTWMLFQDSKRSNKTLLFGVAVWLALFTSDWRVFAIPVHHGGALVVCLWWSWFYLQSKQLSLTRFLALGIVGGLAAASDLFFGVWTLIPLGLTSVYYWYRKECPTKELVKRAALGVFTLSVTYGSVALFKWALNVNVGLSEPLILFKSIDSVKGVFTYLLSLKLRLLFILAGVLLIFRLQTQRAFFGFSLVTTMLLVAATGIWIDSSNVRYLLPIGFFISVVLSIELRKLSGWKITVPLWLASITAFATVAGTVWRHWDHGVLSNRRSAECVIQSLSNKGLLSQPGLGTYWAYKMVRYYSNDELKLRQTDERLETYNWLSNSDWFPTAMDGYSYVITTPRESDVVRRSISRENGQIDCIDFYVLLTDGLKSRSE